MADTICRLFAVDGGLNFAKLHEVDLWPFGLVWRRTLTLYEHSKTAERRTIIRQYGDLYTGRWWVGIWYSKEGPGRAAAPPIPLVAKPNGTAIHQRPPTNFMSFDVGLTVAQS